MKKLLIGIGICAVCLLLCGCSGSDKPIAPADIDDKVSSVVSMVSEVTSVGEDSSVTISESSNAIITSIISSEVSEVTSKQPLEEGSEKVLTLGSDIFLLGWSFNEVNSNGWVLHADDTTVAPRTIYDNWVELDKGDNKVFVSVYNNDDAAEKKVSECQIVSVSADAVGSQVLGVSVGMNSTAADDAWSELKQKSSNRGYASYLVDDESIAYYFYYDPTTGVISTVGFAMPTNATGEIFA